MATLGLIVRAVAAWWNDDLLRRGASVAYYTLFSIAPILLIAIAVAGAVFGDEAVRGEVLGQIDGLVGRDGGAAVQALLEGARSKEGNLLAAGVGLLTSLVAAGAVFLELQSALNAVWRVTPAADGVFRPFLVARLQAFGLVLALGFLLLVSLAISAGLGALATWLSGRIAGLPAALTAINWALSIVITGVLFALLFKVLPDADLHWTGAAVGGLVTAVLFTVGKHLIGLYLAQSAPASSYGAVGSVMLLLLWVFYSSQILLIGAEFTRLYGETASGGQPLGREPVPVRPT